VAQQKELTRVECYRRGPEGLEVIGCPEAAELIRTAPVTLETKKELPLVWIDILNPAEAEAVFLRDELGMHPLAVEDCLRGRQRPKIDRYPGISFWSSIPRG
jgi:magnesium transporter